MIDETMQLQGAMTLIVRRASGDIETVHKDNIIVNVGFDFIADAIGKAASRPSVMGFIALGTGTTAAAASQSALVSELDRNAATYAHTVGTKDLQLHAPTSWQATARGRSDGSWGIQCRDRGHHARSGWCFPVVNKGADDSLTAVFTFTMS